MFQAQITENASERKNQKKYHLDIARDNKQNFYIRLGVGGILSVTSSIGYTWFTKYDDNRGFGFLLAWVAGVMCFFLLKLVRMSLKVKSIVILFNNCKSNTSSLQTYLVNFKFRIYYGVVFCFFAFLAQVGNSYIMFTTKYKPGIYKLIYIYIYMYICKHICIYKYNNNLLFSFFNSASFRNFKFYYSSCV